ncbi:uncharacterized protein RCC_08556 [Ramularia collo-cygni]|uniref:F-box domain-containing protein n=1 Tax=Ramularia collo-cygni TaxID=112498 RepID=A0A2D3V7H6_9PEZI|nr:uncharacterized protein RCC_08556 [Ramularia collo-cygni]CZT22850.1 uncharacterized protein RCC_08556 [Ramularia collo-cygni]
MHLPSSMDRLPEELLALICEHCEHADLKVCRLVNKRLCEASTCHVFEDLYLGLFEYSLFKARDISKSPLAKHVKRLTIYSDIVPSWTKDSWLGAIDFRPAFSIYLASRKSQVRGFESDSPVISRLYSGDPRRDYDTLPRHTFTESELTAGWNSYQRVVGEQTLWRQDAHGLMFKELFSLFPNLTDASVQCAVPFSGRCNTWPLWRNLRERIFVGPDDFVWRQPIEEPDYAHQTGQAALLLLEAIGYRSSFAATKQITKLNIHSSHLDPYLSLMDRSCGSHGKRYQTILAGFQHLTSLYLHVPHATVSAHVSGLGVSVETMEFLRTARHLRKLDLRYGDDEMSPDDESDSQLESLFDSDDVLWPQLEKLSLATNVPAEILLKFLRNHADSLNALELRDMLIHNVDLAIQQIPKILTLQHCYMECLWDDASRVSNESDVNYLCVLSRGTDFNSPYEESVKAYLLGQSETMPPLERDGGSGEIREWAEWQAEADDAMED